MVNIATNKWVFKVKHHVDELVKRFKTRLVARGFPHNAGVDYFETFSPVVKPSTIKIVSTLAITFG